MDTVLIDEEGRLPLRQGPDALCFLYVGTINVAELAIGLYVSWQERACRVGIFLKDDPAPCSSCNALQRVDFLYSIPAAGKGSADDQPLD